MFAIPNSKAPKNKASIQGRRPTLGKNVIPLPVGLDVARLTEGAGLPGCRANLVPNNHLG
jgi:hypothetical protein